jgi:WD40 repeat protein
VYEVSSGSLIKMFPAHSKGISSIICFNDFLITASFDSTLKIWDSINGYILLNCLTEHKGLVN